MLDFCYRCENRFGEHGHKNSKCLPNTGQPVRFLLLGKKLMGPLSDSLNTQQLTYCEHANVLDFRVTVVKQIPQTRLRKL